MDMWVGILMGVMVLMEGMVWIREILNEDCY